MHPCHLVSEITFLGKFSEDFRQIFRLKLLLENAETQ